MQEDEEKPGTAGSRLERVRERIHARMEEPREKEQWLAYGLRLVRIQEAPVELWVAIGVEGDYVLIPGTFCSCPHFTYRVAGGETVEPCYHLVALEIARREGRYSDLSAALAPEDVQAVIVEILAYKRSRLLRAKLYHPRRPQP